MPDKNQYRTHACGELRLSDKNVQVTLVGFVDGSMMEGKALDVRDRTGATSILMPEQPGEKLAEGIDGFQPVLAHTEKSGVAYETIADLKGVQQPDKLDDANALMLIDTDGSLDLRTIALP